MVTRFFILCCFSCYLLQVLNAEDHNDPIPPPEKLFHIELQSPVSTHFEIPNWPQNSSAFRLQARIMLPKDLPEDFGLGMWLSNNDGHWQQKVPTYTIEDGSIHLDIALSKHSWLQAQGQQMPWSASQLAESVRGGLFFWSEEGSSSIITIDDIRFSPLPVIDQPRSHRLLDLSYSDQHTHGEWKTETGKRSEILFSPENLPANPYDPKLFKADLLVEHESGASFALPAFYREPQRLWNRGDREMSRADGAGHFAVRLRPQLPGTYKLSLTATWGMNSDQAHAQTFTLPPLIVTGEEWDDYVRVDPHDSRFFSINDDMFWPIGINIRSINDLRGAKRTHSKLTPDFGTESYQAYFRRVAAAGGNAVEIWLSNWNLAMEWRGDWPEFRGLGRYSQARAARLDTVLDSAYENGIRINFVIRNHGQASAKTNTEWKDNPYNLKNGGIIDHPKEFFTDPAAFERQDAFHRYIVGRFGDHPAILGWKLFSEVNLTAGRGDALVEWHRRTAGFIAGLDSYGHPISSHWSGDYRTPNRKIVALDELTYTCIDAYHGRRKNAKHKGRNIVDLMWDSTQSPAPGRGLMQFGKPLLVTEYGGSHIAAPPPQLIAEHTSAPWASLVAGHGGSPMLWWFEWVDQNSLWGPYHALAQFTRGEDLRGSDTNAHKLLSSQDKSWAGAWGNNQRLLGYAVNKSWSFDGSMKDTTFQSTITIPKELVDSSAKSLVIEWWDADKGVLLKSLTIANPQQQLALKTPPFKRHIAFKIFTSDDVL